MFKNELNKKYKPGVLLGYYNIEAPFLVSIKNCLEEKYKNNINYVEITSEKLKIQKIRIRKEKNFEELGMISMNWIEKIQEYLIGLIIQMIDITDIVNNSIGDNNKIGETVIKEISKIKNFYQSSNQLILIKNFKKYYGLEDSIKNQILSKFKNLKDKCIIFINDPNYMTNLETIKRIAQMSKEEITNFYTSKIKYYRNKYKNHENNGQKEYAIKNLIKTFLLSKFSNIINIDNSINYYDYIQKAYKILSKELNKRSYMFCQPNIKIIYLELKNTADFLIYQFLSQKDLSINAIINLIISHLNNFDFIIFNDDKKTDINIIINSCKKLKDIYFINMSWKNSWYMYLLDNFKKIDLVDSNYIYLKGYILNNLFHLYSFLICEPNFLEEINNTINLETNYKRTKNNKYLEKIPKDYEMNKNNIVGKLTDEENLSLYICELIFENKNLIKEKNIIKIIENLVFNSQTNYYDYFLINKYCLKNDLNEKEKEFDKILEKLLYKNHKNLNKFPKIYSNFSSYLNKFILESKVENKDENNYNIFKQIEYLILYYSKINKDLTNEETRKINEILSYDIIPNDKIELNSFENQLFKIDVNYNVNEVKPLDFITTNVSISLIRKDIVMIIDKIIVYFPKNNKNEKEKNYKEINLNEELSINHSIKFSFNKLVKLFFSNLYVINIELYLKNKLKIKLINKEKRNIVFNNKNNELIKEKDLIDIKFNKKRFDSDKKNNMDSINKKENSKILLVGKNENHLFNINYKTKIENIDLYIKHSKVVIKLISGFVQEEEEIICFSFKTINSKGYNNCGNKELVLEYENKNYDKNPPPFEFILQIGENGNFGINYEIDFTLINKQCPDDSFNLKIHKNIILQCIDSFRNNNEVNSSLYYINQQNKIKAYPIQYPINIISFLRNKLLENVIIKKIIYSTSNNSIQINSSIERLFLKKHDYKIKLLSDEKISFHCKIISNENSNGSIGTIKILWISEELFNHKDFNESMLNESIFVLNNIIITKLPLMIQGNYINKINKYQLKIKNLESMSKIIKFSMKEINRNPKEEKFILSGKTNINEVLLPLTEFNIQYNVYDTITGSSFIDLNENITYKFNNLITLNEYYILDNKDKFDLKALRNIIYYIPELFKL